MVCPHRFQMQCGGQHCGPFAEAGDAIKWPVLIQQHAQVTERMMPVLARLQRVGGVRPAMKLCPQGFKAGTPFTIGRGAIINPDRYQTIKPDLPQLFFIGERG